MILIISFLILYNVYALKPNSNFNDQMYTSNKQKYYQSALSNHNIPIVLCTGPAGTGKTMFACSEAIKQLNLKKIDKIIITRPTITVNEDIGFLPGTLEDKLYPYMIPIYDYFSEFYTKDKILNMIKIGTIEIAPLGFVRGRTFKNTFILADEMQNSTPAQFKMLLTRIGLNSKLVITGDLNQNDLPGENGLNEFIKLLHNGYNSEEEQIKNGFQHIELDNSCIQRHSIIEKILNLYGD
jgi:phosphate starvation-inducible PhoH-like protein